MDKTTATIIGVLALLMIPSVSAVLQCGDSFCNDIIIGPSFLQGDNVMIIDPTATRETKGFLYKFPIVKIVPEGRGRRIISIYYDVIVDVEDDKYKVDEIIKATIIIINKGYWPDRDGVLVSYLLSPSGKRFREQKKEFELIPPTCYNAKYDPYLELCIKLNNDTFSPTVNIETRLMTLPEDAELGEWKFVVEYETRVQPKIIGYDSFEVIFVDNLLLIFAIGMAVFIIIQQRQYFILAAKTREEQAEAV